MERAWCAWRVHAMRMLRRPRLRASSESLDEGRLGWPERRRGASHRLLPALPDGGHLAYRARGGRAHDRLVPHHVGVLVQAHERTLERGEIQHELLQLPVLAHELDPVVGRDDVPARQLLTRLALGAQPVAVHRNFDREELRDERAEVVEEAEETADAPLLRLLVARDPLGGALNRGEVATDGLMRQHQALDRPIDSPIILALCMRGLIILSLIFGDAIPHEARLPCFCGRLVRNVEAA
eukprot:scaffold51202_cov65-Phaeocystis_antarctica.AAC.4